MKECKLRMQTLAYWELSRSYKGHPVKKITTEQAFQTIASVLKECGPKRKLHKKLQDIKAGIIKGSTPTPKQKKG